MPAEFDLTPSLFIAVDAYLVIAKDKFGYGMEQVGLRGVIYCMQGSG